MHCGAGDVSLNRAPGGRVRLTGAARLILRVEARSVILLMTTGMVAEVPRW